MLAVKFVKMIATEDARSGRFALFLTLRFAFELRPLLHGNVLADLVGDKTLVRRIEGEIKAHACVYAVIRFHVRMDELAGGVNWVIEFRRKRYPNPEHFVRTKKT